MPTTYLLARRISESVSTNIFMSKSYKTWKKKKKL